MSNLNDNFQSLSGLGDIAEDYDAIFCDIWGVVHNGKMPYLEACSALERFREERGPVIMISNSPQPSVAIPDSFARLNVPGGFWDAIVTSGDATIDELARRAPGPAFKLGPERDDELYASLDMNFSDLDIAEFISCTGLTSWFIAAARWQKNMKKWGGASFIQVSPMTPFIDCHGRGSRKSSDICLMLNVSKAMTAFSSKMGFMERQPVNLKLCSRNTASWQDICRLNCRGNSCL